MKQKAVLTNSNNYPTWESLIKIGETGAKAVFNKFVEGIIEESKNAEFIQNPLATAFFQQYQSEDTEISTALNLNRTKEFYQYLFWKIYHREPVNISFFGVQRGGKSGSGISLGLIHSKLTGVLFPNTAEKIIKNQNKFLSILPFTKNNELYIIDEQKIGHSQIGGWASEWEIEDFNKITAKKCISEIWICPDLIDRGGEYALKVLGIDRERCLTKCLIFDLRNSEDETFKLFGYCVIRHYDKSVNSISPEELEKIPDKKLNWPQILRKNYEKKKDIQIEELQKRYQNDRNLFRLELAKSLTNDDIFKLAKNQTERKIVARTILPEGLVEEEIEEIVKLGANSALLAELLKRLKNKHNKNIAELTE